MPREPLRTTVTSRPCRSGERDPVGDLVGTDRAGGGVARDVDGDRRRSWTSSSVEQARRAGRRRPGRRAMPSTSTAGPSAQLPKQNTWSSATEPSAVVSPSDAEPLPRAVGQLAGADGLARLGAADPHRASRPAGASRKSW